MSLPCARGGAEERGGGVVQHKEFSKHNPSVTYGASSPCTGEPFGFCGISKRLLQRDHFAINGVVTDQSSTKISLPCARGGAEERGGGVVQHKGFSKHTPSVTYGASSPCTGGAFLGSLRHLRWVLFFTFTI